MTPVLLSQLPIRLGLQWVAGDPISLQLVVRGIDWSGAYTATVGGSPITVTAVYDSTDTTFTWSATKVESAVWPPASAYPFECRNSAGLTRFNGSAKVL